VQSTRKITKAMEMVAASKMRRAQDRTKATRPYIFALLNIITHVARANAEYKHPFMVKRETVKRVGMIVITTDKGLCGALNTNVLRLVLNQYKEWRDHGIEADYCAIGNRGLGFLQRMGGNVVSSMVQIGDRPHLEKLIGPVKVLLDSYLAGKIDEIYLAFSRFINTMKQDAAIGHLLPIRDFYYDIKGEKVESAASEKSWDYIYEPDASTVLNQLLIRYVEAAVFQLVAENMACEQSARMVAMKAASDNAADLIDELTLIYNKSRQAAITKELAEIVGGAAAV
jgi:F-type H+-transporting ATPase subunit gamma